MPPLGAPIESRETLLYTRVRLAWYYRPSDVSDRPVSDSRLLLAAIYSEVCDINQMRSKCFVVHKDKISDLSGWKKRPDCFYFNRLFDPYIKKEYEIIQSSDVRNRGYSQLVTRHHQLTWLNMVSSSGEHQDHLVLALRVCRSREGGDP